VLCLEYLSRLLNISTSQHPFNYHPKSQVLRITHLAFTDDILLFARGDVASIGILWESVMEFGQVSGLKANALKSNLYMAGVGEKDKSEMMRITDFPHSSMPFRYLGLLIVAERLKFVHFSNLLERIKNSMGAWSQRTLSYACRLQLIKSIVQGVEYFWLSILPIPSAILNKLTSFCRGFL
jgi:hypothetical protein